VLFSPSGQDEDALHITTPRPAADRCLGSFATFVSHFPGGAVFSPLGLMGLRVFPLRIGALFVWVPLTCDIALRPV
jgi:hypothetical protein